MRNCVTHHHACDCREERFAEIERQRDELLAALKRAMPALETIERRAQHGSPDGWKEAKADVIAAQSAIAKAEAAA